MSLGDATQGKPTARDELLAIRIQEPLDLAGWTTGAVFEALRLGERRGRLGCRPAADGQDPLRDAWWLRPGAQEEPLAMDEEEPVAEREVGGADAEVAASPPQADAMEVDAADPGDEGAPGQQRQRRQHQQRQRQQQQQQPPGEAGEEGRGPGGTVMGVAMLGEATAAELRRLNGLIQCARGET